ncbi:hypothetical protein QBC46DRAFT_390948 [Diplogelasinospora grovesii]|uniref:Uncharacterized protein n=1 Tax=Diplogelasinospora grovesii TaxID=303347 RepID=A0AAN6N2R8_9PEZI|nr:hypothetical protein QBC46DRAFT_390948 [Diplogelasinospora grovesii]
MPQKKLTSVKGYANKLINVSKTLKNRMELKPAEEQRVSEAFALLAAGGPLPSAKALMNKRIYVKFLQRVEKILGLMGVVLCAVGLGVSAVVSMGEQCRVDLPHKLKKREEEIAQGDLQNIANTYSTKFFPPSNSQATTTAPALKENDHFALSVRLAGHGGMTATSQFTGDAYKLT